MKTRMSFLFFSILALGGCSGDAGAASERRLIGVEQQLARSLGNNKGVKVSLPTPDTLLVHVPIGRDIIRNGPRATTNLDSASRLIARSALAAADSSGRALLTVVVELSRSRQIGPFVWSTGRTRAAYPSTDLRAPPPAAPATPIP